MKLVRESLNEGSRSKNLIAAKRDEITEACYNLVNGDDVESEPISEEEIEELEQQLGESLDDLSDPDYVAGLDSMEIDIIYNTLATMGVL